MICNICGSVKSKWLAFDITADTIFELVVKLKAPMVISLLLEVSTVPCMFFWDESIPAVMPEHLQTPLVAARRKHGFFKKKKKQG